jgi:hypothetical protein
MARGRVLTSFVVTLGVLALLVALSLRNAGAQADPLSENTTLVANLPVAGMLKTDAAAVHVVNLGMDPTASHEKFTIWFVSPLGAAAGQIIPPQQCDIGVGETCTVWLMGKDCPSPGKGMRCTFRAVVVGDPIACVPNANMGTGEWMTNLEMVDATGVSRYVGGETGTLRLPTEGSCPGSDQPPDNPSVDAPPPSVDAPPPSVDAPPPSVDAAPPSIDAASLSRAASSARRRF